MDPRPSLTALAAAYFKIGCTAFGGPAAQLAMFEDELVVRRGWVSHQRFLDFMGVSSLIPGPSATESGLFIAREVRGIPGLVVAGLSFIGPAALITLALTFIYVRWGALPAVEGPFTGIKAAILAVIVAAVWRLGGKAFRERWTWPLGALAFAAVSFGLPEIPVLLGGGAVGVLLAAVRGPRRGPPPGAEGGLGGMGAAAGPGAPAPGDIPPAALAPPAGSAALAAPAASVASMAAASAATAAVGSVSAGALFWYFFKVGAFLYGGGYVLIAFLKGGAVEQLGWLTDRQLLDAIAIGQITPGPLFTIATAVGYIAGGPSGALAATAGIFLPGLVFVGVAGPWIEAMRRSPLASGFLDGANATAVGIMAAVMIPLARGSVDGWVTALIAAASAAVALRTEISSVFIVLGGAALGGLGAALGWL